MKFTIEFIEKLAPKPTAFKAGKKLGTPHKWNLLAKSKRSIWGEIQGSGAKAYKTQVDLQNLAYKCTCPSRQFPCKHSLALLLNYVEAFDAFNEQSEPEYVKEWLDKREAKANKVVKEAQELSAEDKEKRARGKAKRSQQRHQSILDGINELSLWLKDMLRLGLLELPTKPHAFYNQMAARMVDAKAPGLANWILEFKKLNFGDKEQWQQEALNIIAKLHLLMVAYKKHGEHPDTLGAQLKSLLGWNISTKDILADSNTYYQSDQWLVLGSKEEATDDLTIHRTWLKGLSSGQSALILAFENQYSNASVQHLFPANVLEAELAFYPSPLPFRAFIHQQKGYSEKVHSNPSFLGGWSAQHDEKLEVLKRNPWANNQTYLVKDIRLIPHQSQWILCDAEGRYRPISTSFSTLDTLSLVLEANHQAIDLALIEKPDGVFPLGFFKNQKYQCI